MCMYFSILPIFLHTIVQIQWLLINSYKTNIISSTVMDNLAFQLWKYVPHVEVSTNLPLHTIFSPLAPVRCSMILGKDKFHHNKLQEPV